MAAQKLFYTRQFLAKKSLPIMFSQSMRHHLLAISIAFSLALFGATAQAMTSEQAEALARSAYLQKDASSLAKLQAAAQSGDANAQDWLGVMYQYGQGVPQDYAQALAWYRKAADQGYAAAQNNLGFMYDNGQGVPQDYVIAYALYNLSATGNPSKDNPATSNRTHLASIMTEQQIERAQQLTQRMQSIGVLKAINAMPVEKRTAFNQNPGGTSPKSIRTTGNSPWPARPEKVPGETTCNTRCINGSCWRTYDNGRHVHLNVAPSVDPFSGNITFNPPPC
ncbi:tetratricopeptide repeat protein [Acidithiobacillus sp.]|uniref:tetratricopeptide repeat protein n=1 Tax=Acidithiobacillus sp. TaxID=1872118 RepID=UPI0025BB33B3|nr:tetratricopeptide repeat protein [Acidithiobacillus sp.]